MKHVGPLNWTVTKVFWPPNTWRRHPDVFEHILFENICCWYRLPPPLSRRRCCLIITCKCIVLMVQGRTRRNSRRSYDLQSESGEFRHRLTESFMAPNLLFRQWGTNWNLIVGGWLSKRVLMSLGLFQNYGVRINIYLMFISGLQTPSERFILTL